VRILIGGLSEQRIAQIEASMRPGEASLSGFLAPGERLADVIARDERTCAERRIAPEQIADRLESLIGRAVSGCDGADALDKGLVADGFRIGGVQYRGYQRCPFVDDGGRPCEGSSFSSGDYRIEDVASGRTLRLGGLLIHLVRDHHFFEGSVEYRLAPAEAIDVLALEPGVDYAPRWVRETRWTCRVGIDLPYEAAKKELGFDLSIERAREVFEVAPGVTIYWIGAHCIAIATRAHTVRDLVINGIAWDERPIPRGTYACFPVERARIA
jgi:hypothetical protein